MATRVRLSLLFVARFVFSPTISSLVTLAPLANGSPSSVRSCFDPAALRSERFSPCASTTDNQSKLNDDFQFIFDAINTLGQDPNALIDCSEVIPAPKPANFGATRFPPGKTNADIEQAVSVECVVDERLFDSPYPPPGRIVRLYTLPQACYGSRPSYLCRAHVSDAGATSSCAGS